MNYVVFTLFSHISLGIYVYIISVTHIYIYVYILCIHILHINTIEDLKLKNVRIG